MTSSSLNIYPLKRTMFRTASIGLATLVVTVGCLFVFDQSDRSTVRLFIGLAILSGFAFTFWMSYRSVKEIEVGDDQIVFQPVGFSIPYSKIESVDVQSDYNGHVTGVAIRSHEPGRGWIPLMLLWLGQDIRVNLFGADAPALLSDLSQKFLQYQSRVTDA